MKLLTETIREQLLANGRANRREDGLPRERDAIDHKPAGIRSVLSRSIPLPISVRVGSIFVWAVTGPHATAALDRSKQLELAIIRHI